MICPIEHSTKGIPGLENHVWHEVDRFMKAITKMNYSLGGSGTIFMETNIRTQKGRHTVLECFRLDPGIKEEGGGRRREEGGRREGERSEKGGRRDGERREKREEGGRKEGEGRGVEEL
jgi:hypothetical protein